MRRMQPSPTDRKITLGPLALSSNKQRDAAQQEYTNWPN